MGYGSTVNHGPTIKFNDMAQINCIKGSNQDILYYQNDVFDDSLVITDDDGNPENLAGKALLMQVKYYRSDETSLAELTEDDISVSGDDDNILTFSGEYDIESGVYYYDLRNTDDKETILYGQFIVTGDVSKDSE
jgi:hypothetical protein